MIIKIKQFEFIYLICILRSLGEKTAQPTRLAKPLNYSTNQTNTMHSIPFFSLLNKSPKPKQTKQKSTIAQITTYTFAHPHVCLVLLRNCITFFFKKKKKLYLFE